MCCGSEVQVYSHSSHQVVSTLQHGGTVTATLLSPKNHLQVRERVCVRECRRSQSQKLLLMESTLGLIGGGGEGVLGAPNES